MPWRGSSPIFARRRVSVEVAVEVGAKKTFISVDDWPGWCRGAKDAEAAQAAILVYAPRYARIAERAGLRLPDPADGTVVAEVTPGGGGTDFGVPSVVTDLDRRPTTAAAAARQADLVAAAWAELDAVVAVAPEELRKGPRGGGRNRDKVVAHIVESDQAYANEMGIKRPRVDPTDRAAVEGLRAAMLDVLRQPSDGSPLAGRKWPPRYAARRIAWHALDHAWEIEDRTDLAV
jgi:hypothetical protein